MMSVGTSALLHWTSSAISDEEFELLVARNPELCFERTAEGDLIVTPPTATDGGRRNAALTRALGNWNEREGKGVVFDSSTGFRLPDTAIRSPDASWIANARWEALSNDQRETYAPLCPDVAIEILSHTDNRKLARERIEAFRANGAALVVLIDPFARAIEVDGERRPWQRIELAFPGCDTPFVLDPASLE
jgi:Uma2 family endonuclease